MSKRGEDLLVGIGMMPKKKKPPVADDETGDDVDTESMDDGDGDEDVPEHAVVAAESLCRKCGWDEEDAPAIAKLIRQIGM